MTKVMRRRRLQPILCYVFALFFFIAGILHFTQTEAFAKIVPPLLPFPYLIVRVTGALEIIFAAGLLISATRAKTGVCLALFLLAVLPANIYMALADIPFASTDLTAFQLWFRVFLQFPLIGLILWASRVETRKKGLGAN